MLIEIALSAHQASLLEYSQRDERGGGDLNDVIDTRGIAVLITQYGVQRETEIHIKESQTAVSL